MVNHQKICIREEQNVLKQRSSLGNNKNCLRNIKTEIVEK